jgi:hypothetical protein
MRFISSLMSSEGSHYIITFARSETRTICGPKSKEHMEFISFNHHFWAPPKAFIQQPRQYRSPDEFTFGPQHVAQNDHML